MMKGTVVLAGLLLGAVAPLQGQARRVEEADLPRWVQEDVINFFNDPSTIHFTGRTRIPSSRVVVGDAASLGGPFTIAGRVDGDLVVVNGDLVFESGGAVTGDVLIVGGRVLGPDLGEIAGTLRVYDEPLRYIQRGDRISSAGRRGEREGMGPRFSWGDARFTVTAGQNYNRIEGLPVMFGPSIRTAGANPLRLDLFAVWRTEMGLDLGSEDFGYALRTEQAVGGRDHVALGGTYFSVVEPVEDWALTNLEASLATFILHKDYRDYYERAGWSAYARFRLPFLPVQLKAEYIEEDHDFARVTSPWSLTKNNDPWRPQPLVAEGRVRFLQGAVTVDTRNNVSDPTDGWYIHVRGRRGLGGSLTRPAYFVAYDDSTSTIDARPFDTDFFTGFLDVRKYNRINPSASLNLRGIVGGALSDVPLPPQYQHALGGPGSLPGFPLFYRDCGAREVARGYELMSEGVAVRQKVFEGYGCDRFALLQAEFRGGLFVDWSLGGNGSEDPWNDEGTWYPNVELSPQWSAFFDLGKGWNVAGDDSRTLSDVGVGIYLGDLGAYYAFPLTKDEEGKRHGNFFIRLSRRF